MFSSTHHAEAAAALVLSKVVAGSKKPAIQWATVCCWFSHRADVSLSPVTFVCLLSTCPVRVQLCRIIELILNFSLNIQLTIDNSFKEKKTLTIYSTAISELDWNDFTTPTAYHFSLAVFPALKMDTSSSYNQYLPHHQPHHFQSQQSQLLSASSAAVDFPGNSQQGQQQHTPPLGQSLLGEHGDPHHHSHHLSLQMSISSSAANSTASFSPSSYRSLEEADQIVPDTSALAFASAARHHFHHPANGASAGLSPNSAGSFGSSRSHSIWSPKYHATSEVSDTNQVGMIMFNLRE